MGASAGVPLLFSPVMSWIFKCPRHIYPSSPWQVWQAQMELADPYELGGWLYNPAGTSTLTTTEDATNDIAIVEGEERGWW